MSDIEYSSADHAQAENAFIGMECETDDCMDHESQGSEIGAGNTVTPPPSLDEFYENYRYYSTYPV